MVRGKSEVLFATSLQQDDVGIIYIYLTIICSINTETGILSAYSLFLFGISFEKFSGCCNCYRMRNNEIEGPD